MFLLVWFCYCFQTFRVRVLALCWAVGIMEVDSYAQCMAKVRRQCKQAQAAHGHSDYACLCLSVGQRCVVLRLAQSLCKSVTSQHMKVYAQLCCELYKLLLILSTKFPIHCCPEARCNLLFMQAILSSATANICIHGS